MDVWIDNQAHENRHLVYPHSTVEIEASGETNGPRPKPGEWLVWVERLVETIGMELGIVLGNRENNADYLRTPLGVGIGLIKVNWIMCFGEGYSRLIAPKARETHFFDRHEFGRSGLKAFVSAPSFEAYQSQSGEVLTLQKKEIGDGLFHRLPVEERRGTAEAYSIFSAKAVTSLLRVLHRQHATNWRRFQAKVVPEYYKG